MSLKAGLLRCLSNIPGWNTKRKILVIESDDWGSIRMPSKKVYEELSAHDIRLSGGSDHYNRFDTLAQPKDLAKLFEVLSSFKGSNGRCPIFTAVSLVANPDFYKIKSSDFSQYYYEPFTETLRRYGYPESFSLWQEGVREELFIPEFHGREHLQVPVWLSALQAGDVAARKAFKKEFWGFDNEHLLNIHFQAAFDVEDPKRDLPFQAEAIRSGLDLFEKIHGYRARFFVPPNGPFNNTLEHVAAEKGIKYLSTAKIQKEALGKGRIRYRFHYLGQRNRQGLYYLTRNCFFEPSTPGKDWVNACLAEIEIAFRMLKPAVISSHRVNYIGALDPTNSNKGLKQLKQLLEGILKRWPEVEFMTSSELGDIISGIE